MREIQRVTGQRQGGGGKVCKRGGESLGEEEGE